MRFVHLSDTRLGFSDLEMIDPESGVNLREQDFYRAWRNTIEGIVKLKPDFVVHAGNLFHSPRPNNRAISEALSGIQKLGEAGIPVALIAGNRSTPRIGNAAHILESTKALKHVSAACDEKYERFDFGDCAVYCLPHCATQSAFEKASTAISQDAGLRFHVLLAHGVWRSAEGKTIGRVGEFNERVIDEAAISKNAAFDYVALGHSPKHERISESVFYSGALERTNFEEADFPTGFVLVDLGEKSTEFVATPCRRMMRLGPFDCAGFSANEIYEKLENETPVNVEEMLVRVELNGVSRKTLLELDASTIDEIFKDAVYVEKAFEAAGATSALKQQANIDALAVEFDRYIENAEEDPDRGERFLEAGHELLRQAEAQIGYDSQTA